jgi:sporulation protein YlmC with PRC-barrel domain
MFRMCGSKRWIESGSSTLAGDATMKSLPYALMGAALVGWFAGSAPAQERAVQRDVDVDVRVGAAADADSSGHFYKASDLIGMEVRGENDQDLGEVQDLLVDSSNNEIEFLVLDTGLFADLGGKQPIIPWALADLHVAADTDTRFLMIPIAQERIKTAPAINIAEVDLMKSSEWRTQVDTFYEADLKARRTARPSELDRDADDADRPRDRNPRPGARDRDADSPRPDASNPDRDTTKPDTNKPDTDQPDRPDQPRPRSSNP